AVDANGNPIVEKVEFSEAQQAKVNELIQEAMGRAGRSHQEKATALEANVTTLKSELDQAKAALAAATTTKEKNDAKGDVTALQAQIDEMRRAQQSNADEVKKFQGIAQQKDAEATEARKEALEVRKQVAITQAASKINFVDSAVVTKLTHDSVKWDTDKNRFIVIGPTGQTRLNASFDPMTLEEFYNEFATQNPYLVRGDFKGGAGSSSRNDLSSNGKLELKQVFGKGSNSKVASQLMKDNPNEYRRMKKEAQAAGLIG